METRATYGSSTEIRRECLMPFADGWQQPSPEEVRAVLRMAGLTGSEASRLLGVSDGRTVRRWTGGDAPIPFAAWAMLCEVAGLGTIWKPAWLPGYDAAGQPTSYKYAISAQNELGMIEDGGQVRPTGRIVSFNSGDADQRGDEEDAPRADYERQDPQRFDDDANPRNDDPRRDPPRR